MIIGSVEFSKVEADWFIRGSLSSQEEMPQKEIFLSSFYIGKYLITNAQYRVFLEDTGYRIPPLIDSVVFGADNHPIVCVSWHDAKKFCRWFSQKHRHACDLPTEAQWERACRGTNGQYYSWGNAVPDKHYLNTANFVGHTTPVGTYSYPSPCGCYDMLGNVWEWCRDVYDEKFYQKSDNEDPLNDGDGKFKVIRGASWRSELFRAACAHRCYYNPSVRSDRHGFRVVIEKPELLETRI